MKNLMRYLMMAFMAMLMMAPMGVSEASRVAVLPLINNSDVVEDVDAIYFQAVLDTVKLDRDMELVDNDLVADLIAKNTEAKKLPTAEQLKAIAAEAKLDYVIAIRLDTLEEISLRDREGFTQVNLDGACASYKAADGKYKKASMMDNAKIEPSVGARSNMCLQLFGDNVQRYVKRALEIKKITVNKQRLGGAFK